METNYQYSRNSEYDKTVKLKEFARLRCFSKKALKKACPKKSYEIVGAIGEGLTKPEGQFLYGFEERFYYHPKQSGLWHRTVGYIEVGEGQYFSVIKKTKRVLFLPLAAVVLAGVLTVSFLMDSMNGLIDRSAVNYEPPEGLNTGGSANSIAIPGYRSIYVEAGTDTAAVALWNPASNPCFFRYRFIAEDGEVLFESGLIPPGKAVTEAKLSKRIPEGEQKITIEVNTFSLEDYEQPLNGGAIKCTLVGYKP